MVNSGGWHGIPSVGLLFLLSGLALPMSLRAQAIGGFERSRGRHMLGVVREHLERHYYDPAFQGLDLKAAAARVDSQIQVARSNSEILTAIAEFVQLLNDSHTLFYPPGRTADVEYGWKLQMIGDACYVVRVQPGSDAAAKGLKVGDRVIAVDRYLPSREHFALLEYFLQALSPRPRVRLVLESSDSLPRTLEIEAKITPRGGLSDWETITRELETANRNLREEVAKAGAEIEILRLRHFGTSGDVDRAMARVRKAGVLILDLRGNLGGLVQGLVRLVGHVFDRPVVVATIHRRNETEKITSMPVRHPFGGRLYVLIDSYSASSSEMFARLVQLEGRGLVLGDRSAGLVRISRFYSLSYGGNTRTFYGVSVTDADVILPDGHPLEGVGVEPDALVLPGPGDLAAGRDPVLSVALGMAGYPLDPVKAAALFAKRPGR